MYIGPVIVFYKYYCCYLKYCVYYICSQLCEYAYSSVHIYCVACIYIYSNIYGICTFVCCMCTNQ